MKILSYFSCLLSTSLYLKSHYVNYDEVNRTQLLFIIITSSRVSRQSGLELQNEFVARPGAEEFRKGGAGMGCQVN